MIYNSYDKRIYLYGGIGEEFTKTFNDLWAFDFNSNQWVEIQTFSAFLFFMTNYWWVLVSIVAIGIGSIIGIIGGIVAIIVSIITIKKYFNKKKK